MAAKKSNTTEPKGYAEAMREVETILSELDSNTIDIDVLSEKVARASFLIEWCNDRISATQMTVDALVASLAISDTDDDSDFDEDDEDLDDFDDEEDFEDDE
jgi:exodeoxyribonuclease VII small subunit